MIPVLSLAIPILVSAVLVFLVSSVIHMVLPIHRGDMKKVAREDELMDAMRRLEVAPGDYCLPYVGSPENMKKPEFLEKMKKGPVVIMTVSPGGPPAMGASLLQWFLYTILVGVFSAYLTGRALPAGSSYLEVFRFAGCVAFMGYSLAVMQSSIWYRRSWTTTIKVMFDGLVYGLVTGGTFGWLWPR